jgi:predicted RecB family nuclease
MLHGFRFVSTAQVEAWKGHALAWQSGEPSCSTSEPCVGHRFIALDLEYEQSSNRIWLTLICVVNGESREYALLWADDDASERRALRKLARVLATHPTLPLLTWNGKGYDLPKLEGAVEHHHIRTLAPLFEQRHRHRDLYDYTKRYVSLPRRYLDLKTVADYFGVTRLSPIPDGKTAGSMYLNYLMNKDEAIKTALIQYGRDDLDSLIGVAGAIRRLALESRR